jgi:hypothetical protein
LCRARGDKNNEKKRRKERKRYQQQHVTAGAPTRKSVPFQAQNPTHSLQTVAWRGVAHRHRSWFTSLPPFSPNCPMTSSQFSARDCCSSAREDSICITHDRIHILLQQLEHSAMDLPGPASLTQSLTDDASYIWDYPTIESDLTSAKAMALPYSSLNGSSTRVFISRISVVQAEFRFPNPAPIYRTFR